MADGSSGERIEMIRNVPTLEALYDAAAQINMTPGWVRRSQPILWARTALGLRAGPLAL